MRVESTSSNFATSSSNNSNNNTNLNNIADGIGENTLEVRFTLKKSTNEKKDRQFFGQGGAMISDGKNGMFGNFRLIHWVYDAKNKSYKTNPDGTYKHGKLWFHHVSKSTVQLTPEQQMMATMVAADPKLKAQMTAMGMVLPESTLNYEELDAEAFDLGGFNPLGIRFAFNCEQYRSTIEGIREMVDSAEKAEYYSLVIRFDADKLNAASDIKTQYNQNDEIPEELLLKWKEIKIYPTYIGVLSGATKSEDDNSRYINPTDVRSAIEIAKEAAKVKKQSPYISTDFLKQQADIVNARLDKISSGKKAHEPVRDAIFAAAETGDSKTMEESIALLRAIELRGSNAKVTPGYTDKIVESIKNKFLPSTTATTATTAHFVLTEVEEKPEVSKDLTISESIETVKAVEMTSMVKMIDKVEIEEEVTSTPMSASELDDFFGDD